MAEPGDPFWEVHEKLEDRVRAYLQRYPDAKPRQIVTDLGCTFKQLDTILTSTAKDRG